MHKNGSKWHLKLLFEDLIEHFLNTYTMLTFLTTLLSRYVASLEVVVLLFNNNDASKVHHEARYYFRGCSGVLSLCLCLACC